MTTYNNRRNVTNDLGLAVMHAVAKRIARTRKVDLEAAKKDELQSISAMTPDEIAEFVEAIIRYAIELG